MPPVPLFSSHMREHMDPALPGPAYSILTHYLQLRSFLCKLQKQKKNNESTIILGNGNGI